MRDLHVRKMEKKGIRTETGELNRWIKAANRMVRSMQSTIAALKEWIQETNKILREPQEIYMAQLLSEAHTMQQSNSYDLCQRKSESKEK